MNSVDIEYRKLFFKITRGIDCGGIVKLLHGFCPLGILRVIDRGDLGIIHRTAFQIGDKAACDVRVHQTAVDKGRRAVDVGRDQITDSVNQLVDLQNACAVFIRDKTAQTVRVIVCRFRKSAGL